ncbi:MAG: FtsW/RodA/SpoVE family cell cycle protein, partial [Elusimicrobiota bacterium]
NLFGTLLAAGITFLLFLQSAFNVAMSIGLLPTKGLPLPFFSYGGSSLLVTLASVGVLLNISRQSGPA